MKVGIIKNRSKEQCDFYAEKLESAFKAHGAEVMCGEQKKEDQGIYESADIIISIGGDGTFLRVAANTIERSIPVFGFNLGTLGFLTEFDKNNIDDTVAKISRGEYTIEERRVLSVSITSEDGKKEFCGYALNDCVVSRELLTNVAYLKLYINDIPVDTYPCDGIIVATQTGSTAYSLSAGGPIIEPGNDVVLITPVASHSMGSRSIVARPESSVKIQPVDKSKKMCAILDGHFSRHLEPNETVCCESTDKKVRIMRIDPPNFYTTVTTKLFDRGENKGK